jgi:gamma-glutamylcyclotransferase (GGCT)/AIG2-like uncharacterized protein YtfP
VGTKSASATIKLSSKISPFIKKLQQAPDGYPPENVDVFAPSSGPYFFYGTLMDPFLLSEILDLPKRPTMRPAKIAGYSLKLWGQYPALVDGPPGSVVEGMVYNVEHGRHGEGLAKYETRAYRPVPCLICFTDGGEPKEVMGMTFKYAGTPTGISEGSFDLKVWLKKMGRASKEG